MDETFEDADALSTQLELSCKNGVASEGLSPKKAPARSVAGHGSPAAHGLL